MKRKLIEVAIPAEVINREAAREGFIYRGNPSAVHKWWAQRALAACRAVLFASLVDDPGSDPDRYPTVEEQDRAREDLFDLIGELVVWENSTNEHVLERARAEILRSTGGNAPAVLDPFCGGGSIPLEAQRLGLTAYASDLNPVAVLITKALIEIPPKFANMSPVHPDARRGVGGTGAWEGAAGLAEDVRRYGAWMRDEAERRIGNLYPKVRLAKESGGAEATVIAWLWARSVICPNPACGVRMPLARSFALSTKKGKEVRVVPVVDAARMVSFTLGGPGGEVVEGTVGRLGAHCVACASPVRLEYIRQEGRARRLGTVLMAIVAEGPRGRIYLPPDPAHIQAAESAVPGWAPETDLPDKALGFRVQAYGMTKHRDLFTPRQLVALTTLSDLVEQARGRVELDAIRAGKDQDGMRLAAGGRGAAAYADAVATYLAFAIDKASEYGCTLVPWYAREDRPKGLFARQAIPMVWDFAEVNPLGHIGGTLSASIKVVAESLSGVPASGTATVVQRDATAPGLVRAALVSTDPPYYDNIGYADLSDFFYVWIRRSLREVWPELLSTVLTPKTDELIASPHRFGGDREKADAHFEAGLGTALEALRRASDSRFPITIWYAFKQAEVTETGAALTALASTGWETMLEGLVRAGYSINGTWPMRTERSGRSVSLGTNALASSIVLVCRPRALESPLATYREFTTALSVELPEALTKLQRANIAPVDLAQAAIGPGMAVFTRYGAVLEQATGGRMSVRRALELINAELDAFLSAEHGDLDRDTRWCHTWFRNHGFNPSDYGSADTLATARNVSVAGLQDAGVLLSRHGKVRLLRPAELDASWDPLNDERLTVWECTHQLVRALHDPKGGVESAARLAARMGAGRAAEAKDLAYGLFGISERQGWRDEAGFYNDLVTEWPAIVDRAREIGATGRQETLGI
jgi:putative DNA methylase